ncbi:dynamin family protein [Imbroritus primus]|uniref:dynamin family protein n=1 Tax=Imbroritus primus TaxID=3058603 RepID=UPI003D16061E
MTSLQQRFEHDSTWRSDASAALGRFHDWLQAQDLLDGEVQAAVDRVRAMLAHDRLSMVFLAEFSRGKTELINALFLANSGRRMLPSSAGRTTMCPTELRYDPAAAPALYLLPIEADVATPLGQATTDPRWVHVPLDPGAPADVARALQHVAETVRMSHHEAKALGMDGSAVHVAALPPGTQGSLELPRWRYAIANLPNPLLGQGLVVIDTPGLNALGTEPELTLRLLPDAHVVVFVLAADTGVTQSDLELWQTHVAHAQRARCLVVLNKIDGLWDPLKPHDEAEAELRAQVEATAQALGVDVAQVYPVSAQKGLVARVSGDAALHAASRLAVLEEAMSERLLARRHAILADQVRVAVEVLTRNTRQLLQLRHRDLVEQLFELRSLRGKKQAMVKHMLQRVQSEKSEFEQSIGKFKALRMVFGRHAAEIVKTLQGREVRRRMRSAREAMSGHLLSSAIRNDMDALFNDLQMRIDSASDKIEQLHQMVDAMYKRFNAEHAFTLVAPLQFDTVRYRDALAAQAALAQSQVRGVNSWLRLQPGLVARIFGVVAENVQEVFSSLNRDLDVWFKSVMTPLEAQVREHQKQLRRRVDSIERVHEATDTLEGRIGELEAALAELDALNATIAEHGRQILESATPEGSRAVA